MTASPTAQDERFMRHCIELSKSASSVGEYPFTSLVTRGDDIVAESVNRIARDNNIVHHAEIVVMGLAQKAGGSKDLSGCTLYTNVEPCPMCSFAIRETGISKVVYAIPSSLMGGHSRWDILSDKGLSDRVPDHFGPPPVVVCNLMESEATAVWKDWNGDVWDVFHTRAGFGS